MVAVAAGLHASSAEAHGGPGFNETDLRLMLEDAAGYHVDVEPGRWVVETRFEGRPWEVIVEPLPDERALLVVTAYPLD